MAAFIILTDVNENEIVINLDSVKKVEKTLTIEGVEGYFLYYKEGNYEKITKESYEKFIRRVNIA